MGHYWGIDLGGTKIEAVVVAMEDKDARSPVVLARHRIPTQAHLGYLTIVQNIGRLLKTMETSLGIGCDRIGIGIPGTVEASTGLVKNANTTCLNGQPFQQHLEKELGKEVRLANDANCFALAETRWGVVTHSFEQVPEVVFGVIMGTGVGGGLVINGQIVKGAHGIAGEWGHNVIEPDGALCYCGKLGCVETVLSGPALESWYQAQSQQTKSLTQIVKDGHNDPHAQATLTRLHEYLGKALATVVNVVDPQVIIIGGGVGNIPSLYSEVQKAMQPWVFNPSPIKTQVLQPMLGDSAGVFGAALL